MDGVSSFTACVAVAGLATKVAKSVNNLVVDLSASKKRLLLLRSQVRAFSIGFNRIVHAAQTSGTTSSSLDTFSQDLLDAADGGILIIKELEADIAEIRSTKPIRLPNGKTLSKVSLMDRIEFLWNEDRINKWKADLQMQSLTLLVLIQSHDLLRGRVTSFTGALQARESIPELSEKRQTEEISQLDEIDIPVDDWLNHGADIQPANNGGKSIQQSPPNRGSRAPVQSVTTSGNLSLKLFSTKRAEKIQKKRVDNGEEMRQQYRQMLLAKSRKLTPDCPKLRLVLLGKSGVGKTRLVTRVCRKTYQENDNLHGQRTPRRSIRDPINFSGDTDELELHDSGGFEGTKTVQEAKKYIDSNRSEPLAGQIHAIWYVISCFDVRPVQDIDKDFFAEELFDIGEIPVFVVFSNYDRFVDVHVRNKAAPGTSEEEVEKLASKIFKTQIEDPVKSHIRDTSKFSFCRVGLKADGSEYHPVHYMDEGPLFGTDTLVKQMTARLRNGFLNIQWISIQQSDDKTKLFNSVHSSVALLWTARSVAKSSYLPYICLVGLGSVYSSILRIAGSHWQIPQWISALDTKPLRAIFDINRIELLIDMAILLYNVVGALSISIISELTLKMILGVNLIGRQIFLLRKSQPDRDLTQEELDSEIMNFRESDDRKRMVEAITSEKLKAVDYRKNERTDQIMGIATASLEASVGYLESSFFAEERLKMLKELNLND